MIHDDSLEATIPTQAARPEFELHTLAATPTGGNFSPEPPPVSKKRQFGQMLTGKLFMSVALD